MTIITNVANQTLTKELSLSTSNVLTNQVPVIQDPGAGEIAANISDPDHSLTYTSGSSVVTFEISYGSQVNIGYVAISGHNAATLSQATIELYNDTTLIDSVVIQRNHNIMFTFPEQTFQDLIIKFITVPSTYRTTVSYVAAGKYLSLTTGEQAGYMRNWLNRHLQQRTSTNLDSAPTAITKRRKALKGNLSLPNQLATFSQGVWQEFIDFAYEQPFFIKEIQDQPESSYICYDARVKANAHPSTRTLDVLQLTFMAYNGL